MASVPDGAPARGLEPLRVLARGPVPVPVLVEVRPPALVPAAQPGRLALDPALDFRHRRLTAAR